MGKSKSPSLKSVTPSTASALEAEEWRKALEGLGYVVYLQQTRRSYTAPGGSATSLWYVLTSAPLAVVALMLREETPAARRRAPIEAEVKRPKPRADRIPRRAPESSTDFGLVEPMDLELDGNLE